MNQKKENIFISNNPIDFLHSSRIDVFAKLTYLKNPNIEYYEHLYKQTIFCSTGGTFSEFDNPNKDSFKKFKETFLEINNAIKEGYFDWEKSPIILDSNEMLVNGSHRLASAIYNKKDAYFQVCKDKAQVQDIIFFEKNGLGANYMQSIKEELIFLKKKYKLGIIWGLTLNNRLKIIDQIPNIILQKSLSLTENGKLNLIKLVYQNEPWIKDNHQQSGIYYKALECFKSLNEFTYFVFEDIKDEANDLKKYIRSKIGLGKHSMHICDDHDDSIRLFKMFNNNNSFHLINMAENIFWNDIDLKLQDLFYDLKKAGEVPQSFLIDGTMIMGLYGLREANDLDLISFNAKFDKYVRTNNENYHSDKNSELIFNPENYVNYNKFKFISLTKLAEFKSNRCESKDQNDILLIKTLLKLRKRKLQLHQLVKRNWYKYKSDLIKLLTKLGIYKTLRKIILRR